MELGIRGYHYKNTFRAITGANYTEDSAILSYNNWITLADAMTQFLILRVLTRDLLIPTSIDSIHCDPNLLTTMSEERVVVRNLSANYVLTTGLEIYGYGGTKSSRRRQAQEPLIEKYVWMPYVDNEALDEDVKRLTEAYLILIDDILQKKPKEVLYLRYAIVLRIFLMEQSV